MKFNELIKEAHANAVEKRAYRCPECDGKGIDQNKNIPELLMLVISKIGEAVKSLNDNQFADWKTFEKSLIVGEFIDENISFEMYIKNTFENKIATVFIRIFDLYGYFGIEIDSYESEGFMSHCHKNKINALF